MKTKRLPKWFTRGRDHSIACRHRDLSCCPECAAKYEELVEVACAHFWVSDPDERAQLRAEVAAYEEQRAVNRDEEESSTVAPLPEAP